MIRLGRIATGITILIAIGWAFSASAKDQAQKVPDGPPAQVQFQIVHAFGAAGDGVGPGGLVMDSNGNLYGTTESGGAYGYGTVYELMPGAGGEWTETILYNFPGGPPGGYEPLGLVIDGAGNLYGVTQYGGANGDGTVYELSPGANGVWTESILYNFCSLPGCADGVFPTSPPTLGPGGSLYGIAGTVAFQLTPGSGGWMLNVLYTFCENKDCPTGSNPSSGLTLDAMGNLYGETAIGGQCGLINPLGCGVAYALHEQANGQWEEFVLHEFQEESVEDGGGPNGGLTFHDGGLYGVTLGGGDLCVPTGGCGTVFDLTHGSGQMVNEQIVWNFGGEDGALGALAAGGVAFDRQGNLFGVTGEGGSSSCGCGVVYGMKPQGNGKWGYAVLHTFNGTDGYLPDGGLTIDSKGDLFGTTGGGGEYGYGVAFELSPTTQASK